jgi:hypothetical protein
MGETGHWPQRGTPLRARGCQGRRERVRPFSSSTRPSACSHAALFSLDEQKAQAVVDEIAKAGGDAIAVGGDVGADDFPEKVLGATIKCVPSPLSLLYRRNGSPESTAS